MSANGRNIEGKPPEFELLITRTFNAPRELVWNAWTDPEMARQWMGPHGFTTTSFIASTEVGGHWRLTMEGSRFSDGLPVKLGQGGRTLEFDPPRRLVYTFAWDDRSAVGLGGSVFEENLVTITFDEVDGTTIMKFRQTPFATEGERDGHSGGWNSTFDKFAEFLRRQP